MPATGYLQVRAYTSTAQFPLADVAVAVVAEDGAALALLTTDRSGRTPPVQISVPDKAESQSPDPGAQPFRDVTIHARLQGYEQVEAEHVQVFADTVTDQDLELIPLAELPDHWDQTVVYDTPPQDL